MSFVTTPSGPVARRKPGRPPRPIVTCPEPLHDLEREPFDFQDALDMQMRRHGDSSHHLQRALAAAGGSIERTTLASWLKGLKSPQTLASLRVVDLIEARYRLPKGYLRDRLQQPRAPGGQTSRRVTAAEARRLAWHLPDDFASRPARQRAEILDWVRSNILSSGIAYSIYHQRMSRHRFGLRFPGLVLEGREGRKIGTGALVAPAQLQTEMQRLLAFKTATLTKIGFQRSGVWGRETAAQRTEHLSLLFGALAAPADGEVGGHGVARDDLSFSLLVFPASWDWYVRWREARRGFYTGWEAEMLLLAAALSRRGTGWLRQSPDLADRLTSIGGLVSAEDIDRARADWDAACDALHDYAVARARELSRVSRVHRDPFEPLLPVLEAASPVGEYRKIADEILKRSPCRRRHPRAAAEANRGYLMLRLGLHLGLRQKNLRQLMFCPRGQPLRSEGELDLLKRGELRWSDRDQCWEAFVPCSAFKNANSGYFSKKPFRLALPDLRGLYRSLEDYIAADRKILLAGARDPGTFFVKTAKSTSRDASFNQSTFYEAWRTVIQRYGIYNPWTGKGAIVGLLPHGPHSVRDVLATHVLKTTGSYEQASYAIQDTPATVANHYGRFLPQDKAALAAQVLNRAWED